MGHRLDLVRLAQDQIDAFRAFTIGEEAQERFGYPALSDDAKRPSSAGTPPRSTGSTSPRSRRPARSRPRSGSGAGEALGRLGPVADAALGPTTAADAERVFRLGHPWAS